MSLFRQESLERGFISLVSIYITYWWKALQVISTNKNLFSNWTAADFICYDLSNISF